MRGSLNKESAATPRWELKTAFAQGNFYKGYRYLDLAGVVLNRVGEEFRDRVVGADGTTLLTRLDSQPPRAVRFSTESVWLHFLPIDSLATIRTTASQWIQSIAKDLEVTEFTRVGVRAQFFLPREDIVSAANVLRRMIPFSLKDSGEMKVPDRPDDAEFLCSTRFSVGRDVVRVAIQTIHITRPAENPGDYPGDGLLLDIDAYRRTPDTPRLRRGDVTGVIGTEVGRILAALQDVGQPLLEGVVHA